MRLLRLCTINPRALPLRTFAMVHQNTVHRHGSGGLPAHGFWGPKRGGPHAPDVRHSAGNEGLRGVNRAWARDKRAGVCARHGVEGPLSPALGTGGPCACEVVPRGTGLCGNTLQ